MSAGAIPHALQEDETVAATGAFLRKVASPPPDLDTLLDHCRAFGLLSSAPDENLFGEASLAQQAAVVYEAASYVPALGVTVAEELLKNWGPRALGAVALPSATEGGFVVTATGDNVSFLNVTEDMAAVVTRGVSPGQVLPGLAGLSVVRPGPGEISPLTLETPARHAFQQAQTTLRLAAVSGLLRACVAAMVEYANVRVTFDTPIGRHQAVQLLIADAVIQLDATVSLWSGSPGVFPLNLWLERCVGTASDAVQLFGGYGYTVEYPVSRLYQDAMSLLLLYATPTAS